MNKPKQKTKYLVELGTGFGVGRKKRGCPTFFTGHRRCANKREALDVAGKLRRDKPLLHVRIVKTVEIVSVVAEWTPSNKTNNTETTK
jgi:hypothetical protein